jgi:general secretion pathway protein A
VNPYQEYFRFKKAPFSISPNPNCLFMSQGHREALIQLKVGLQQSGGFVLLTGEVGTGKTTLCRKLISELDAHYRVGLIFNPQLDSDTLLETIADAFGIPLDPSQSRQKQLAHFEQWLQQEHSQAHHVVVVIDEAQNLSYETLEALRLLTNIETDTEKMLQVVLIGQPELLALLKSPRLRQLNQRITARYHLGPLSLKDVKEYVHFRLVAAEGSPDLFSGNAIKMLYLLSQGTPRIINLLCDQSLLFAYEKSLIQVGAKEVKAAHRVRVVGKPLVSGSGSAELPFVIGSSVSKKPVMVVSAILMLGLLFSVLVLVERQFSRDQALPAAASLATDMSSTEQLSIGKASIGKASIGKASPFTANAQESGDINDHLPVLARLWGVDNTKARCDQLLDTGLRCWMVQDTLDELLSLNLPALLSVEVEGEPRIWLLEQREGSLVTLTNMQGQPFTKRISELAAVYQRRALVVWQPPESYKVPIRSGDSADWVPQLRSLIEERKLLGEAQVEEGWEVIRPSAGAEPSLPTDQTRFDWLLERQVRQFQEQEGLHSDGIVGPKTWIHLQNDTKTPALTGR